MSGGSWGYLYSREVDELVQCGSIELLEEMADYLNSSGYKDVAKDVRRLVEYIKSARIRIETLHEMLSPVFKAVEWYDSADWSKERVDAAIEEYRNGKVANT
jgi:hypothetical protein|nr:MAG TPA: hypothetical protein [Caudoviricetes sp.]